MAEISFDCVESIKDMGAMLGGLTGAISMENEFLIEATLDLADEVVKDLLQNCPHPPNVTSDQAPPRKFARQLRELRSGWRDQTSDQSVWMIDSLNNTLDAWLAGMMGATPSAAFIGGRVPRTMPHRRANMAAGPVSG